jgi:hypothetical protein
MTAFPFIEVMIVELFILRVSKPVLDKLALNGCSPSVKKIEQDIFR